MNKKTRNVIITGVAIALSVAVILFLTESFTFANYKFLPHGILLNFILIMCTLICGLSYGATLSVVIPVLDYMLVSSTYLNAIFLIPIMLGNILIVLIAWFISGKKYVWNLLPIGLVAGAFAKSFIVPLLISLTPKLIPELKGSVSLTLALKHYNFNSMIMPLLFAVFLVIVIWPVVKMVFKKL